jgi:heavy metal efflux system protein
MTNKSEPSCRTRRRIRPFPCRRPHSALATGEDRSGGWAERDRAAREPAADRRAHQHSRRDQGSFAEEAQEKFAAQVKVPEGYRLEWGGQFDNVTRAKRRLSMVMPLTVGIIFVWLFFAFGNTKDAGIVLLNVPFSLVGGILFLWLRGINLSVSAAVGFISLFGVAVMSGVLVVSEINRRLRVEGTTIHDAVVQGALSQLSPVLMMIVVALLGMVPAARATGIGSDVQRPLATVVVGGLASTLFLTFLALPALCVVLKRNSRP